MGGLQVVERMKVRQAMVQQRGGVASKAPALNVYATAGERAWTGAVGGARRRQMDLEDDE